MWEILAPEDLYAQGLDGYVHLEWTNPPDGGEPGVGDECEFFDYYGNYGPGYVDCTGQCVAETYLSWLGDGLCDDGTWGVFFNCDEWNWDEGDCPEYNNASEGYSYRSEYQLGGLRPFVANQNSTFNRDLIAFNIYRDGEFLAQVDANTYMYDDYDVSNLDTYCYTLTSLYDEGESTVPTEQACATPEPGVAPFDLYAYPETDIIMLEWQAATNNGGGAVIDYNIYRDGALFATTTGTAFADDTAEHDVEYCYEVTANFPSGESLATNQSCSMWILAAPLSVSAVGGNGFIELEWTEPGVATCADEVISSLPFNALGSNVGMGNEWTVQGSEGADYAYLLVVTNPIIIDVTVCSAVTTYDTKLEIFTADQDCNEVTTGYYIDDFTCEFNSLQSTLQGVSLQPGQYYIVVDGYGGQEGEYEINVTESVLTAQNPNDIEFSVNYEEQKLGEEIGVNDWMISDESNAVTRDLLGFDIYRDNSLLESVSSNVFSHTDLGLENGTQYCYYIVASYDEGDSQPTPEVCAAPDAGPMCPPQDLVTNVEDGDEFVSLQWTAPDAGCEGENGDDGGGGDTTGGTTGGANCAEGEVEDCSGDGDCCPQSWIGDGFGDCVDQAFGCDLSCYDNDGGDCYYNNPNDGHKAHLNDLDDEPGSNTSLRLNGYSIYRDNIMIAQVSVDQTSFDDYAIEFGQNYCYKVKAIYEEGESNPTNESCETVIDPGTFSTLEVPSLTVQGGDNFSIPISLNNQLVVAGFQFTLTDTPDLLTGVEALPTERTEGFTMSVNEFNGELIVVAFSLTGATIEVGNGPVVEVEYSSALVDVDQDVIISSYDVILGDPTGDELPSFSVDGIVTLTSEPPVNGCTDETADNYNPDANVDDGSCMYTQYLDIAMLPYSMNLISFNVESENMSDESVFADINPILISNDSGGNYAPDYGICLLYTSDAADE